jgi:hypothetical protein
LHNSSYIPLSSMSSLPSTSSTSSLSLPSIPSHSRHESLPSSSRDDRIFDFHFSHNFSNVQKRDSLKYENSFERIECECDIIAVPNDYYYNNDEQHDYCSKMKTSRQRKHEIKCKHISKDIAGFCL